MTRTAAFQRAWSDPAVAALVAVRGGYGSVHLLPLLDRVDLHQHAKGLHRLQRQHLDSLVADVDVRHRVVPRPDAAGTLRPGRGGLRPRHLRAVPDARRAGRGDHASTAGSRPARRRAGMLIGGTLTQLTASLGTPYAFAPPDGCVLFLDEVGERPYRLDRLLTQLRLSGILARVSAIVFGELPDVTSRTADHGARRSSASCRRLPRARALRSAVGPHERRDADAAVRRPGARDHGRASCADHRGIGRRERHRSLTS